MNTKELFDEFLNYLRYERHFSPHTAKCYSADLKQSLAEQDYQLYEALNILKGMSILQQAHMN